MMQKLEKVNTKYAIHKDDFEKLRVYFVLLQICHKKSLRYYSKTCIKYLKKIYFA